MNGQDQHWISFIVELCCLIVWIFAESWVIYTHYNFVKIFKLYILLMVVSPYGMYTTIQSFLDALAY